MTKNDVKGLKVKSISGYVQERKGRGLNAGGYCFVWLDYPPTLSDGHKYEVHRVRVTITGSAK